MRRAFTVPEMLAVIAVILIVLAILLPNLSKSRDSTLQVICANNNRQLVQASLNYALENTAWMPFTNWLSQEDGGPPEWQTGGWMYDYPGGTTPGDYKQGQLWRYLLEPNMYRCPIDHPPFKTGSTHVNTSYLMNGAYSGFGGNPTIIFKRFRFQPQAIMFWEVDEQAATGSYNDASSFPSEPVTKRHISGLTVGCQDGHTEWMTYAQFAAELANGPGRLWCNPLTANGH